MRKRPSKKEKVFTVPVQFYVTPHQKEKLARTAAKAGIGISECLRRMIDKLKIIEKPSAEVSSLLVEIRKVGTNLNQIARVLNAKGFFIPDELSAALDGLNAAENKICDAFTPGKEV